VEQDASSISVLGGLFLACMVVLTFSLPRQRALMPLLITTCFMPLGQGLVVAGMHFQLFRILLLLGIVRVLTRKEGSELRLNSLDKLFLAWGIVTLVLGTLTDPSFDRFNNRSGEVFNAFGSYFLFRCWMRNTDDIVFAVRLAAIMLVVMAVCMINEKLTTRNIFSVFGGVPEFTGIREGKLRCQGAFRHPILAGTYAATLFPLFIGLWFRGGHSDRRLGSLGAIAAGICTVAAASSGALLAIIGTIVALIMWRIRTRMRQVRWGIVLAVLALALTMNAPIWYMFARLSEVVGGTGWYRSYIIEQAVNHFNEWWLVGSDYTAHWAPGGEVTVGDRRNLDIIDQYVAEGLAGGILKLGLFLAMIVQSFKIVGRRTSRPSSSQSHDAILVWSFGACLIGHCLSFFSVSYFDQIVVIWYWLLAAMAVLADENIVQAASTSSRETAELVYPNDKQRDEAAGQSIASREHGEMFAFSSWLSAMPGSCQIPHFPLPVRTQPLPVSV